MKIECKAMTVCIGRNVPTFHLGLLRYGQKHWKLIFDWGKAYDFTG